MSPRLTASATAWARVRAPSFDLALRTWLWTVAGESELQPDIDLASGEREGGPVGVGPEPGAVAIGGGAVWVVNNGDGTVTRIEP